MVDPRNGGAVALGAIEIAGEGGEEGFSFSVSGIAFDSAGVLYATSAGNRGVLLTLDPDTGVATEIGRLAVDEKSGEANHIGDITFVGEQLYGWDNSRNQLVEIDTTTGAISVVATDLDGSRGMGLVAQGAAELLCLTRVDDVVSIVTLEGEGAGTATDGIALDGEGFSTDIAGLARKADGDLLAVTGDGGSEILAIDGETGAVTLLGYGPGRTDAVAIPASLTTFRGETDGVFAPGVDLQAMIPATARAGVTANAAPKKTPLRAANVFGKSAARGERMTLSAFARVQGLRDHGALVVRNDIGEEVVVSEADRVSGRLQLQANRRGKLKLMNTQTGLVALRNIAEVVAQ